MLYDFARQIDTKLKQKTKPETGNK